MGKTSSASKDKWNAKAYDQFVIRIPKGRKADIEAQASRKGESVNGLINRLICAELGISPDEWKIARPGIQKD